METHKLMFFIGICFCLAGLLVISIAHTGDYIMAKKPKVVLEETTPQIISYEGGKPKEVEASTRGGVK